MPALARLLEAADAETLAALVEALSPDEAGLLGVSVARFGGATALRARRVDVLWFNRVVGLGLDRPVTEAILDDLIAWYAEADIPRFFVQLSPDAEPEGTREWLAARGLAQYNTWVKLWRRTEDVPRVVTDLRIERVGSGHAPEFATIVARGFGMPDAVRPWLVATVGRPGWHHYLARDGERAVAAAALFVREDTGWLGFAATDPAHRGRGAQSALVARRVADAQTLGCRRLVVETTEDLSERHTPSFRNLRRLGFEFAYARPNYLWTAPPGTRPAA